jgi:outer membrane lipoprotein-sorting protein
MVFNTIFLFSLFVCVVQATPSADQILKQAEKYRGLDEPYLMTAKVTNRLKNVVQEESEYKVYIKDNSTSLVEQTEPASGRGKKLLMIGSDLWMRTPDIKKAIRISLEHKLTGEIANGDLAKTNFYSDYSSKLIGETSTQYKLHLTSKHESTTYQQIYYYINKSNNTPARAEFMAISGKILKTMEYAKPDKTVGTRTLVSKMKVTDAIVKDRTSTLIYGKFKPQKIDDSTFNRASL